MSVLNPEISSLTSQYDTGRATAEEFAPRGGGRAAVLEELPFQKAGAIENLIQGAQVTGAEGVSAISQLLGNIGLGEIGVTSSTAASTFGQLESAQQNQQQQAQQAGQAIGTVIALLAAG